MDKQVIETLIRITEDKIDYYEAQAYKYEIERDTTSSRFEACMRWKKHYQDCLDQLQKLKEFEFPSDKEIGNIMPGNDLYSVQFRCGARWMKEKIKEKLS